MKGKTKHKSSSKPINLETKKDWIKPLVSDLSINATLGGSSPSTTENFTSKPGS